MSDGNIHNEDPGFEEFVERELLRLGERAQEQDICIACLTARLIVELVAGLTRGGISARDILSMVIDGIDLAGASANEDDDAPRRMH